MDKIYFDFEGDSVELSAGIGLMMNVFAKNNLFLYKGVQYLVYQTFVDGIEQEAENEKTRKELLKDPKYNGDMPRECLNLHVKLKKA